LITHAYSKALLFLRSGSIIHSMEALVGYSPVKSLNMILMSGLIKHVPITKTFFLVNTFSIDLSITNIICVDLTKVHINIDIN